MKSKQPNGCNGLVDTFSCSISACIYRAEIYALDPREFRQTGKWIIEKYDEWKESKKGIFTRVTDRTMQVYSF